MGLEEIGFQQSSVDECVLYQCKFIFIIYVYDGVFAFQSNASIDQEITEIGDKFDI